jgi:hypothetical protein
MSFFVSVVVFVAGVVVGAFAYRYFANKAAAIAADVSKAVGDLRGK